MPDKRFIFIHYLIYRGNVFLGYYQDVRRRYRVDILKGSDVLVLVNDLPGALTIDDSAKDTVVHGVNEKKWVILSPILERFYLQCARLPMCQDARE